MTEPGRVTSQFVRFTLVGGVATAIQYCLLIALVHYANMGPVGASTIGFVISAGCNYALNYRYTFRSRVAHRQAVVRFVIVAGVGLALNSLTMLVAGDYLHVHFLLAQVLATGLVLLWNFAGSRLWTFKFT